MKFTINNSYAEVSVDDCEENALVLDMVWVDPADRGKGLGTKLTKMAIEYAQDQEMELSLCAEPQDESTDGERLIEFYRNLGFESDADCDKLMKW